ncbi:unnamed protein product [Phytophthora fragariaefolia]|uniref:Unnamed protein product n=1 Tax=Phytophthora fragariaefolia TaxID=1490495 RepID=A0A9W7D896_9STRA|nr:unnamed protein product [Phytophthora fragariaefolia]
MWRLPECVAPLQVACDSPTSAVAASTIVDWYSRFGAPKLWISDSGSHFKNKVVAELSRRLKFLQEFVLAYSLWKNGSVERVNRDILQVLKRLALEYKVSLHDWPYLLPLVQSGINHSPQMHKLVKDERQRQAKRCRSRPHYEQTVNFSVGDYVLHSRVDEKLHANKLRIMWVGPYRVVGSVEYYFTVEHLVNGSTMDVHPSRLNFYADDSLNVTEELLDHIASQGTLLAVEAIVNHKLNSDIEAYEVKVKWLGLETIEDSWEPCVKMFHNYCFNTQMM